jgi:DNA polymerase-1
MVPTELHEGAKYWIVAESPWKTEVDQGLALVGQSGQFFWKTSGLSREECNITNAVLCMPPALDETKKEILEAAASCCRPRLLSELTPLPTLITGEVARDAVLGPEDKHTSKTTIHGRWVGNALSTYHPSAVMRDPDIARDYLTDLRKFKKGPKSPLSTPGFEVIKDLGKLLGFSEYSYDLETDQTNFMSDDILCMAVAVETGKVFIVPGAHPQTPGDLLYSTKDSVFWKTFWSQPQAQYIGHNAKFDMKFLRYQLEHGAVCTFDTMLAHNALDDRSEKEEGSATRARSYHDLKGLAAKHLDVPDYEVGLHQYLKSRNDQYSKIPWGVLCQYVAWDVTCTLGLKHIFEAQLRGTPPGKLFYETLMPMEEMYTQAEIEGLQVDREYLQKEGDEFNVELAQIENEFLAMASPHVTNLNSPPQMSHYFYDVLGLPHPEGRKVKPNSTNKDALMQLKGKHPAVSLLSRHRKIEKMRASYADNLLEVLDYYDLAHYDTKIGGTEVGRISVRNPAIQTVPRSGEPYGKLVKDAYIARKGCVLLAADVSQAELRVAAAYCGDPFLIGVYRDGRDLHTEVAIAMYGLKYTKEQRVLCKMFNFSWVYGGNEFSFAQDAGLPIDVARNFVAKYNKLMPVLVAFKGECFDTMKKKGYVESRFGRRRRIPYINDVNIKDARKAALHALVAGSASDMVEHAALDIRPVIADVCHGNFRMSVHDSIIFEVPEQYKDEAARLAVGALLDAGGKYFPEVVWKADAEVGYRWGTMEKMHV